MILEAILALPEHGRKAMDNVVFIVERELRHKKTKEVGIKVNEVLFGLYEGIPKIERGAGYFGVLPDKITIFQQPIEEIAGRDKKKLRGLIYEVIWPEVGHHLCFCEKEIRALEIKRRKSKNYKII